MFKFKTDLGKRFEAFKLIDALLIRDKFEPETKRCTHFDLMTK